METTPTLGSYSVTRILYDRLDVFRELIEIIILLITITSIVTLWISIGPEGRLRNMNSPRTVLVSEPMFPQHCVPWTNVSQITGLVHVFSLLSTYQFLWPLHTTLWVLDGCRSLTLEGFQISVFLFLVITVLTVGVPSTSYLFPSITESVYSGSSFSSPPRYDTGEIEKDGREFREPSWGSSVFGLRSPMFQALS